jgi:hypothetical protein
MRHLAGRALAAAALAAACGAAHADARLDYVSTGTCPMLFRSIEIAGPRLRIEVSPEQGEPIASIFDGEEDLVTTLIPSGKTYVRVEVDADAADYTADVMGSTATYMDRQMARAAELMREHCGHGGCPQMPDLASMLPRPAGDPLRGRATGQADRIDGVDCTWREWVRGEAVVRRECLADIAALPLPDADRAGLRRGMRVMMRYGDAASAIRDRFVPDPEPVPPAGQLPIAQQCFADGVATGTVALTARQAPVDPARFGIPAGYAPVAGPGAE